MEDLDKKFATDIIDADRSWQTAEHIIKVVMPVVKDEKLLLRALETIYSGTVKSISIILKYEYILKRVELKSESSKNLQTFFNKCSHRYGLSDEDNSKLKNLIFLGKKHKESGFEFSRVGKMVILGDDLRAFEVNKHTIEGFIHVLRKLIENTRRVISGQELV